MSIKTSTAGVGEAGRDALERDTMKGRGEGALRFLGSIQDGVFFFLFFFCLIVCS